MKSGRENTKNTGLMGAEPDESGGGPETAEQPVELAEGYYVQNFLSLLNTVQERYGDLLSAAELDYIQGFCSLDASCQRLYVRLVCRKGPCFRKDLLSYPEIDDLDRAAAALLSAGYLDSAVDAETELLLGVLRLPELIELYRQLVPDAPPSRAGKRAFWVERLLSWPNAQDLRRRLHARYTIWRPLHKECLDLFRLLFFGNVHQDFSEWVISELGIVRYEDYSLSRSHRWFQSRDEVDQALAYRLLRGQIESLWEPELDSALALTEELASTPWPPVIRTSVDETLNRLGRDMERLGMAEEALKLYRRSSRPPARERICRVLDRLGRSDEALALCQAIETDPLDETERAFAPFFGHRMRRKLGHTREPWKRPRRPKEELRLPAPVMQGSIERQTLEYLAAQGRPGVFAENWLWRSLFGLAFWDVIFAPVPGAFHHPFQLGPKDLHGPDFRPARRQALEERLDRLRQADDPGPWIWPTFRKKQGVANALVPWFDGLEPALRFALDRVSGPSLALICDRLSRHLRRYRRGLPDLLVACDASPVGFELLEVKGPGDQIRPEQGAWIDFLNRHGVPARVLKVTWASNDEADRGAISETGVSR